jgi:hypothetical protein
MSRPTNPIRDLLEQQMGIDAFSLDGGELEITERWSDAPRDPVVRVAVRAVREPLVVKR